MNICFVQGQKPLVKCAYKGRGCILIALHTDMNDLFPIGNEQIVLFFTHTLKNISFYLLNF